MNIEHLDIICIMVLDGTWTPTAILARIDSKKDEAESEDISDESDCID